MKTLKTTTISALMFIALMAVVSMTSCKKDIDNPTPTPENRIIINSGDTLKENGLEHQAIVDITSQKEFTCEVKDGADWLSVDQQQDSYDKGDHVIIKLNLEALSKDATTRTAHIVFTTTDKKYRRVLTVIQSVLAITSDQAPKVTMNDHSIEVDVTSGSKFNISMNDADSKWITPEDPTKTSYEPGNQIKIKFNLSADGLDGQRTGKIVFTPNGGKNAQTVSITQTNALVVKTAGTLWKELRDAGIKDSLAVKNLALSGTLNGADLICLRAMAGGGFTYDASTNGQLESLSLSKISFQKDDKNVYYRHTNDENYDCVIQDYPHSLPDDAFTFCSHLKSFAITDNSIVEIKSYALSYCPLLSDIKLAEGVLEIGLAAFQNLPQLTTVKLPQSATEIYGVTFFGCKNLKSITLPDNMKKLGYHIFWGCTSLSSVILPSHLDTIEEMAFKDCIALKEIKLTSTVTTIRQYAFDGCTSLKKITLPISLKSIEKEVFSDCTSLTDVTINVMDPKSVTLGDACFDKDNKITLYVPNKDSYTNYDSPFMNFFTKDQIKEQPQP